MNRDISKELRHAEKLFSEMNYHEMSAVRNINYRKSGLLLAGIVAAIYAVLFAGGRHLPYLAAVAAALAVMAGFESWPLCKAIELLTGLGNRMQRVTNPLLFGLIYIVSVVPTSLVLKLLRKDVLQLRYDGVRSSYWKERKGGRDWKESFRKQY